MKNTEKNIAQYDVEKINAIIDAAKSPSEAIKALHDYCPALNEEVLNEQIECAYKSETGKASFELSTAELDCVVGGGLWDYFKSDWKNVMKTAALNVLVTAGYTTTGTVGGACIGAMAAGPVGMVAGAIIGGTAMFGLTIYRIATKGPY